MLFLRKTFLPLQEEGTERRPKRLYRPLHTQRLSAVPLQEGGPVESPLPLGIAVRIASLHGGVTRPACLTERNTWKNWPDRFSETRSQQFWKEGILGLVGRCE